MAITDKLLSEIPSRNRIQSVKPTQISNAGLSNPKTPNNPNASLPGLGSPSGSPSSAMPYPDALSTTRRQMAKEAIDTLSDEKLSEVLSIIKGPIGATQPVNPAGVVPTIPPELRAALNDHNPMVDPESDDLSILNAGGRRFAPDMAYNPADEARYAAADRVLSQKPATPIPGYSYTPGGASTNIPGIVAGAGSLPGPKRTLNIPWLNGGNPR